MAQPLRLHPQNPHYFEFRGKPTILVTSGEHYGAVLNGAFDYKKYLATLAADGLNYTRIFSGVYREVPGSFDISSNTLAPAEKDFVAPFKKPGEWNPAYFTRLKDFLAEAAKHGIVVEVTLFCTYYEDALWKISLLHSDIPRTEALTMKHPEAVKVHEAFARKMAEELKDHDNFFWEICNEPYFAGVADDWQRHIGSVLAEADGRRHLIARNIANNQEWIRDPDPNVSIFNFHYARPPVTVAMNWGLKRPIAYDESGFDGNHESIYRIQGWDFILAGGALYNNLDYSFTVGHEDGTFAYPPTQPGGGNPALRKSLKALAAFMKGFDLTAMSPNPGLVMNAPEEGTSIRVLSQPGKAHAVYIHHGRVMRNTRPSYVVGTAERTTPQA